MACLITKTDKYAFINDVDLSTFIGKRRKDHRAIINRETMQLCDPIQTNHEIFSQERECPRGGLEDYFNASWTLRRSGYVWKKKENKLVKKSS